MIHFILGGARSGKSTFAEKQALHCFQQSSLQGQQAGSLYYLATSTLFNPVFTDAGDVDQNAEQNSMKARIEHHQAKRSKLFQTIEEPLEIAQVIHQLNANDVVLIDCLTLWLNNCLMLGFDEKNDELQLAPWFRRKEHLLQALEQTQANIFLVSNEVGQGIVPLGVLSRTFVDESGWLHQSIASLADKVSFITAGLENKLK